MKAFFKPAFVIFAAVVTLTATPAEARPESKAAADPKTFLETYNRVYQSLFTVASGAAWVDMQSTGVDVLVMCDTNGGSAA